MSFEVKYPMVMAATYLWIGFVCAISFMESWLKFRAPGISQTMGLSIGRLVFKALNKVEWGFAAVIFIHLILRKEHPLYTPHVYFALSLGILLLQSTWMLPVLDTRAVARIQGHVPKPSPIHFYFVGGEILKVIFLFLYSINQFN